MKAQDDNLTRPEGIALCVFLHSEKKRHAKDIDFIDKAIETVKTKFAITSKEWERIKKKSDRYVKF